jgi:glycosyltransferase involved in cell wall biosynthesis
MRAIQDRGLRFRLRAIGGFKSEEYRRQIMELVERLGVGPMIDWVGFTSDVPAELRKLHFFVLPSTGGEGLPIAILEAMSAGLPIVTTDVPGNDEVVRDGVDGYLCKAEDSETLADCLVKMMSSVDGWQRMAESAFRRQRDTFSAESMTAGVARVYDRLIRP